jgi:DNA-binding beta-propeller fold protein YncE
MRGTRLDELLAVVAFLALPLGSCATKADAAPESQGTNGGSGAGSTAPSAAPTTGSSAASSTPTPGDSRATGNGGALSALIASASATAMAAGATGTVPASASAMRDVLLVGNSVAGTVSVIDARTYENMGAVNVLPDKDEVLGAINADLVRAIAYPLVKNAQLLHHFEPAGGDRFVDDEFLSPDGTVLYVSRSNLGDVAAFDLSRPGHPRLWRTFVDSPKADHATISPDGSRLVVSATGTSRVADVIDTKTGKIVGTFPTGYYPHQNDYSHDGKFIYNSSIGNVGYNAVTYANNMQKGDRWLVKVDATTLATVDKWVFDFGIRPNVLSADEKILYTQLSYLNGVIKYDMVGRKEIARSDQPLSQFALSTYATYDEYPHDSAHHGLALSGDGERLCDCGTIDNTVQIVSTATMAVEKTVDVGMVPYWATTGPDGRECFVSLSGDNAVAVIDYETGTLSRTIPVEAFPQRSRLAKMPESIVRALSSKASADAGTGTKGPACNPGDLLNLLAPADAGGPAVVSCLLTTCLLDVIGQVGQCMSRCLQAETSIAPACGDCLGRELQGARDTCLTQCGDDFECYGDCALTALGTAGKACLL